MPPKRKVKKAQKPKQENATEQDLGKDSQAKKDDHKDGDKYRTRSSDGNPSDLGLDPTEDSQDTDEPCSTPKNQQDVQECVNPPNVLVPQESPPNSRKARQASKKNPPILAVYFIICMAVVVFAVIYTTFLGLSHVTVMHIDDVKLGINKLFHDFKNQSPRSKKVLQNRVLPYINHTTSPQPFVLMVVAMQEDREAAQCFASRVGKLIVSEPVFIDGSQYSDVKSDQAKQEIDVKLREAFQEDHFPTAAIIHNLQSVPYGTTGLFYAYCDHDNPRYKEATIIFTVILPQNYSLLSSASSDEVKREGVVQTYLLKDSQWAKDEKFEESFMGALLSRITDTVIVVSGESKESLEMLC